MTDNRTVDCFYALGDPNRREILLLLAQEKQRINTIADNFDISRPAVSKHIKVLYEAGFITITTQGRERYCELNQQGFDELKEWMQFFEAYWTKQLKQLDAFLKTKQGKPKK